MLMAYRVLLVLQLTSATTGSANTFLFAINMELERGGGKCCQKLHVQISLCLHATHVSMVD